AFGEDGGDSRDEPGTRPRGSCAYGPGLRESRAPGVSLVSGARLRSLMRTEQFDIVIIGSGAGGGTIAHALSHCPVRLLIVERGGFIPQEPENWSPEAVWKERRYRTTERWLDNNGQEFPPYT